VGEFNSVSQICGRPTHVAMVTKIFEFYQKATLGYLFFVGLYILLLVSVHEVSYYKYQNMAFRCFSPPSVVFLSKLYFI